MSKTNKKFDGDVLIIAIYFAILAILMAFCSGCKMHSFFGKRAEKSVTEVKTDIVETKETKTDVQITENSAGKIEVQEDYTEITMIIDWSEPDSVGNQHPVRTTGKVRTSQKNTSAETSAGKTESANNVEKSTKEDKSTENSETDIKTVEKTEVKKSTPAWVIWVAVISSLGAIVLIYLILKRFKIVK